MKFLMMHSLWKDITDIKRRGLKIFVSKTVCQRKSNEYKGRDGNVRERFLKWKARLAVAGMGEVPGVWTTFSPTIKFAAFRLVVSLMCDPVYDRRSYDLRGAFLGTDFQDMSVYVRDYLRMPEKRMQGRSFAS